MNLLPFVSETLVSASSKDEILEKLSLVTNSVDYLDKRTQTADASVFHGKIEASSFRISKIIQKADTFLPILSGKISETDRGCIIFLTYSLFPGAVFFLGFWTFILIGFAAYCLGITGELGHGIMCFGIAIFNYLLSLLFFQRQFKISRECFFRVIELPLMDK